MRLADCARGRDNNFNLIRLLAALAVLFTHTFLIAHGSAGAEPLRLRYGVTWGIIAVNVFFVTSGFLVTSSLLARKSAISFLWARALRIFPGLWVMLVLTVFVVGLSLTTYAPRSYLGADQTWKYVLKNATLVRGVEFGLPGVFASNPMKQVNGSLWTLHPELQMYGALLVSWIVCAAALKRETLFRWGILAIALGSGALYLARGTFETPGHELPRLIFMFFTGAAMCVFKDRVELNGYVFLAFLAATLVSLLDRAAFFYVFNLSTAYLVLYAAYVFGGPIRRFNRLGDYSYGIYIYAFVVEQTIESLAPAISLAWLMGLSAVVTLALAVISWHLVERRALALKEICTDRTRALIHGRGANAAARGSALP